jgi:hypothetical protein
MTEIVTVGVVWNFSLYNPIEVYRRLEQPAESLTRDLPFRR